MDAMRTHSEESVQRKPEGAKMTKKPQKHPDDLMVITVSLELRAKLNPEVKDPLPFDIAEFQSTLTAGAAVDFLEKVVSAIRERRLYGLMVQEIAENAVGAGDWIKKTDAEVLAEFRAHEEEKTAVKGMHSTDEP
jgi:hypothetical protein